VHKVELSEPKILKQPDTGENSAMSSFLRGLGVKGDQVSILSNYISAEKIKTN
jgi:hypothetical protein